MSGIDVAAMLPLVVIAACMLLLGDILKLMILYAVVKAGALNALRQYYQETFRRQASNRQQANRQSSSTSWPE